MKPLSHIKRSPIRQAIVGRELPKSAPKRTKFGNRKVMRHGLSFDSRLEADRYEYLLYKQQAGVITDLKVQARFVLLPKVKFHDATRAKPALRYFADFSYLFGGDLFVEDTKGMLTKDFIQKRHMMKALLGQDIQIIKSATAKIGGGA